MNWWRKRFRLASVTGVGDARSGWAVTDNGEIVAFYEDLDRAKCVAKRANKRGYL